MATEIDRLVGMVVSKHPNFNGDLIKATLVHLSTTNIDLYTSVCLDYYRICTESVENLAEPEKKVEKVEVPEDLSPNLLVTYSKSGFISCHAHSLGGKMKYEYFYTRNGSVYKIGRPSKRLSAAIALEMSATEYEILSYNRLGAGDLEHHFAHGSPKETIEILAGVEFLVGYDRFLKCIRE